MLERAGRLAALAAGDGAEPTAASAGRVCAGRRVRQARGRARGREGEADGDRALARGRAAVGPEGLVRDGVADDPGEAVRPRLLLGGGAARAARGGAAERQPAGRLLVTSATAAGRDD